MGDDVVVLNTKTAHYLSLNAAGAFLWTQLLEGADEQRLVQKLTERYDLQPAAAVSDVGQFIADLQDFGLLADQETAEAP